uniref:Metallophos domain-containing protein n=1 Tax=Panagrellus redivivus TaxID=6233 RepID=A0A7E4ZX89_PANRE
MKQSCKGIPYFQDDGSVEVDELWRNKWSKERVHTKLPLPKERPVSKNYVRFVCISDTHDKLGKILHKIPDGDVLLHAGDFTSYGDEEEIIKFDEQLGTLPHEYKIVIAGNHELGFDWTEDESLRGRADRGRGTKDGYELLNNCIYLQDFTVEVFGIKVWGSPWHPLPGFPFSVPRGEPLAKKWDQIPADTDVLLTHTPPLGHSDLFKCRQHWGCADLLETIEKRVKPAYHVFGHIHENHGWTTNGTTTFINASICNYSNEILNGPTFFDIPLPPGYKK